MLLAEAAEKNKTETRVGFMSILACRYPLVPTDAMDSDALMSSHMATLVKINLYRTVMRCQYVPEPILQEAAARLLKDDDHFEFALSHLEEWLYSQHVGPQSTKGGTGELIASIILSRAYDKASIKLGNKLFSDPIPLAQFLEELAGKPIKNYADTFKEPAFVSFTKVYQIYDGFTEAELKQAFELRYAILCAPFEHAIDLVIPVAIQSSPPRFGAIFVQVKNYASPVRYDRLVDKLEVKGRELLGGRSDFLKVIFQVGPGGMTPQVKEITVTEQELLIPNIASCSHLLSTGSIATLDRILSSPNDKKLFEDLYKKIKDLSALAFKYMGIVISRLSSLWANDVDPAQNV